MKLIFLLVLALVLVSGCLEAEEAEENSGECVIPADCEGRIHIQCVGAWQCINGKCVWSCLGEYLELPKDEGEGLTG